MHKLTIKNLSKTYPNGVKALVDVNLELENGMFGLLGPNGAIPSKGKLPSRGILQYNW